MEGKEIGTPSVKGSRRLEESPVRHTHSMMLLVRERDESTARRSFSSKSTSLSSVPPFCLYSHRQLHQPTRIARGHEKMRAH
jgi:hypothetical protein